MKIAVANAGKWYFFWKPKKSCRKLVLVMKLFFKTLKMTSKSIFPKEFWRIFLTFRNHNQKLQCFAEYFLNSSRIFKINYWKCMKFKKFPKNLSYINKIIKQLFAFSDFPHTVWKFRLLRGMGCDPLQSFVEAITQLLFAQYFWLNFCEKFGKISKIFRKTLKIFRKNGKIFFYIQKISQKLDFAWKLCKITPPVHYCNTAPGLAG